MTYKESKKNKDQFLINQILKNKIENKINLKKIKKNDLN
jgi:hypothetical protein